MHSWNKKQAREALLQPYPLLVALLPPSSPVDPNIVNNLRNPFPHVLSAKLVKRYLVYGLVIFRRRRRKLRIKLDIHLFRVVLPFILLEVMDIIFVQINRYVLVTL